MMELPIVKVTPDSLGYKDRGLLKWLGMMLSDHSEALKKEKTNSRLIEPKQKERMNMYEVGELLYKAYVNDLPIRIQANVLNNGKYYQDLECKITGYIEDKIYFLLKDGRSTFCTLEQIRNVEFMDVLKWHDKSK